MNEEIKYRVKKEIRAWESKHGDVVRYETIKGKKVGLSELDLFKRKLKAEKNADKILDRMGMNESS